MNAPEERSQTYRFSVFELDTLAHELRKDGRRVRLQEQPYQILLMLAERSGAVVTREELRRALWPSSVYVDFDHGLNNAIARLREALGDAAATPTFIETIPRVGYRFVHPVTRGTPTSATVAPQQLTAEPPPSAPQDGRGGSDSASGTLVDPVPPSVAFRHGQGSHRPGRRTIGAIIAALALVVSIAILWPSQRSAEGLTASTVLPSDLALAVLPFTNLSSEKDNEYFADGLAEELISTLAGIRGLKVASYTASFQFKGKHESPAVIAKDLQVNHLLEGSVRHSGNRVRITAQLIDARDGYHRWSETFDRELTDIFEIQEEIALAVASALRVKLLTSDESRLRSSGTRNPEAFKQYRVARHQMTWGYGTPDWDVIKSSYQAAIASDPNYAAAHAGLAHYYFNREQDEIGLALGQASAERAIALDPELSEALSARANYEFLRYAHRGDFNAYRRGVADFSRALELDPSNVQALFHYGRATFWLEPERALSLFERNIELEPIKYGAKGLSAAVMSRLGRHEEARDRVMNLYNSNPEIKFHTAIHVATLAYFEGHLDQAVAHLQDFSPQKRWTLYMSLGDREAARAALAKGDNRRFPLKVAANSTTVDAGDLLANAALLVMDGRYADAFASLDRRRDEFKVTRGLDVPSAKLGLIAAETPRARAILEQRLPTLVSGIEPINAYNVLPALDLAAAWAGTGEETKARALLKRVAEFLDGTDVPRWPMFIFLRARTHALAGEHELAQQALDRAYEAGFRQTWGVDLFFQGFGYIDPIDADPAFAALRDDPRFAAWLNRIAADNARQLMQLRAHYPQEKSARSAAH